MADITIYCTLTCPYCTMAKRLLDGKGVEYTTIDVGADQEAWAKMSELTGGNTVPQININGTVVGGCDDLYELENKKELDQLLEA